MCTCHHHGMLRGGGHRECDDEESTCGCGGHGRHEACDCGCEEGGFQRRFLSRAERIAELEEYQAELTAELEAVAEVLQELKQKK